VSASGLSERALVSSRFSGQHVENQSSRLMAF
jgi:hypothetical protein